MNNRFARRALKTLPGLLLLAGLMAGCGKKKSTEPDTQSALIGKWEATKETVYITETFSIPLTPADTALFRTVVVEFKTDNTFDFKMDTTANEQGTWKIEGSTLTLNFEDGSVITGPYTVSGDLATLDTNLSIVIPPPFGTGLAQSKRIIFEFTRIRG
jgi:hypothetical protein